MGVAVLVDLDQPRQESYIVCHGANTVMNGHPGQFIGHLCAPSGHHLYFFLRDVGPIDTSPRKGKAHPPTHQNPGEEKDEPQPSPV